MSTNLFKEIDKYIDSMNDEDLMELAKTIMGLHKKINKDSKSDKSDAHMRIYIEPNNDDTGTYSQRIEINGSTMEILPMLIDSSARVLSQLAGINVNMYDEICKEIAKEAKKYNEKGE